MSSARISTPAKVQSPRSTTIGLAELERRAESRPKSLQADDIEIAYEMDDRRSTSRAPQRLKPAR